MSNISKDSETAFHAAHAGIECARLHDLSSNPTPYQVTSYQQLSNPHLRVPCMGANTSLTVRDINNESDDLTAAPHYKALYQYEYDWAGLCSSVSVYKYYESRGDDGNDNGPDRSGEVHGLNKLCPEGSICTIIKSRGYSDTCDNIDLPGTIEREVVSIY